MRQAEVIDRLLRSLLKNGNGTLDELQDELNLPRHVIRKYIDFVALYGFVEFQVNVVKLTSVGRAYLKLPPDR